MTDCKPQPAGAPDALSALHRVLEPMRKTTQRMIERGEPRGRPILDALSALNRRRSFWQPAAHEHFAPGEEGAGEV